MTKVNDLKEYLVGENGYLLNNDNNGKTVMISGAWGSGKTHFWQNKIASILKTKLKENNRANIYVSLYGKDSLKEIKQEVFLKASDEKDMLSKEIETFGFDVMSSIASSDANWTKIIQSLFDLNEVRRSKKGINRLKDGGIICFDDFERKSKKVDLNDLFGFISQLAIELKCKVVIILNSDVFEGKEANVFKAVKEKTINKFFYFEPTIEELFDSIYNSDEKYRKLDTYKNEILDAITETKELNARIYMQVLDNCLEWLNFNDYDKYQLRALVLITVNFIKNHFVFDYKYIGKEEKRKLYIVLKPYYNDGLFDLIKTFILTPTDIMYSLSDEELEKLNNDITQKNYDKGFLHWLRNTINNKSIDEANKTKLYNILDENKNIFTALNYYLNILKIEDNIEEETFLNINNFVKTGILVKDN